MFGLGTTELVIILGIALVIFGGKKLRSLGGDLGGAISEFKASVTKDDEEEEGETVTAEKTDTTEAKETKEAAE